MRGMDEPKFRTILASLAEVFTHEISAPFAALYWEALKDLAIEQIEAGAKFWIKTGKRFPKPAELRAERFQETSRAFKPDPRMEGPDHLLFFANRLPLTHMMARGALGSTGTYKAGFGMVDCRASDELLAARKVVHDLVDEFSAYVRDGDELATPAQFIRLFVLALDRVSKIDPIAMNAFNRTLKQSATEKPFVRSMARSLPAEYARS